MVYYKPRLSCRDISVAPVHIVHWSCFSCLGHLRILSLGQAVLLQQSIDLVRSPQVVVDFACLGLSYCRKLNYSLLALPRYVV
jgi:hypothetical protein